MDYNQFIPGITPAMAVWDALQKSQANELANQQAGLQNDRYSQMTPLEVQGKDYSNQSTLADIVKKQADNQFNTDTYGTKVKATNAENESKVDEARIKKNMSFYDEAITGFSNFGPAGLAEVARNYNMPPETFSKIAMQPDVLGYLNKAKQTLSQSMSYTPKFYSEQALKDQEATKDIAIANERNKTQLEAARIAAEASRDRAGIMASKAPAERPMTTDQLYAQQVLQELANGEITGAQAQEKILRKQAATTLGKPTLSPEGKIVPMGETGSITPTARGIQAQGKTKSGNTYTIEKQ